MDGGFWSSPLLWVTSAEGLPRPFLVFIHSPAALGAHMGSPRFIPGHSGAGLVQQARAQGREPRLQVTPQHGMGKPVCPPPALGSSHSLYDEGPQRAVGSGPPARLSITLTSGGTA